MRLFNLLAIITVLCAMVSCGNDGSGDSKKITAPATSPTLTVPANPGTSTVTTNPATPNNIPANPAPIVTPTTNTASTPQTVPQGKGLNPPHGQPGHRCDISVGAPLDSKPTQIPSVNTTTPTVNTSTPTVATPTGINTQPAPAVVTAPGMNPPHGQPGHRCDIAVGAPLNSKPQAAASTVQQPPAKQ